MMDILHDLKILLEDYESRLKEIGEVDVSTKEGFLLQQERCLLMGRIEIIDYILECIKKKKQHELFR